MLSILESCTQIPTIPFFVRDPQFICMSGQFVIVCNGFSVFRCRDLTEAHETIVEQGGDFLAAFLRSISLGIPLNDNIVDQLYRHKELSVARTYDYLYYTAGNV
jgi:hypothetical protein